MIVPQFPVTTDVLDLAQLSAVLHFDNPFRCHGPNAYPTVGVSHRQAPPRK